MYFTLYKRIFNYFNLLAVRFLYKNIIKIKCLRNVKKSLYPSKGDINYMPEVAEYG